MDTSSNETPNSETKEYHQAGDTSKLRLFKLPEKPSGIHNDGNSCKHLADIRLPWRYYAMLN